LLGINGIGAAKLERYADDVLAVLSGAGVETLVEDDTGK
jgi:hypothetical protein